MPLIVIAFAITYLNGGVIYIIVLSLLYGAIDKVLKNCEKHLL